MKLTEKQRNKLQKELFRYTPFITAAGIVDIFERVLAEPVAEGEECKHNALPWNQKNCKQCHTSRESVPEKTMLIASICTCPTDKQVQRHHTDLEWHINRVARKLNETLDYLRSRDNHHG